MSALAGRAVWVIGASSGIGAALAAELVVRGARVAISARRADQLKDVAGDQMSAVPLDVTDRNAVDAAAQEVAGLIGAPDLVVFSAGVWEQLDAAAWDRDLFARHIEVNLLGLNNVLGAVLPPMLERGHGGFVVR